LSNGATHAETALSSGAEMEDSHGEGAVQTTSTTPMASDVAGDNNAGSADENLPETAPTESDAAATVDDAPDAAVDSAASAGNLDQSDASIVATTPLLAASTSTNEERDESDVVVVVPTQELLSSIGENDLNREFWLD